MRTDARWVLGVSSLLSFVLLPSMATRAQVPDPAVEQSFVPSLIAQPLDETKLAVLRGNTHPLARMQFDRGVAPPTLPMNRMLLVLRRSESQDSALRKLLDGQQDKSSASYHKWFTPEEFGKQFGPSDQDIQSVTTWLQGHGLQLTQVAKGRSVIEFSGTAAQVQDAFHTEVHNYVVNGEAHWANATDPAIPAALTALVAGIDSLHNFQKKASNRFAGLFSRSTDTGKLVAVAPQFTFPGGCTPDANCYALVPYDFATIYNVLPLWNAGIDGTGQTIAIVGRTNINVQDVSAFRSLFGLPTNPPNIILNGPDPGINGDEAEADIDVQWSGAVAKNAAIDFVASESTLTTDGVDLSAFYIVDNNLAPVMSESYGLCELALGTAGNDFYGALWEQAAAQGMSVFISAGDNGAAGCDDPASPAQYGLNVNGIASTLFNVAVGGTDFNQYGKWANYWNSSDDPTTQASAIGYIPETAWNDSCANPLFVKLGYGTTAEAVCNDIQFRGLLDSIGGSGGKSARWRKPSWQSGAGVLNDGVRDVPDISLFASNGFLGSFYVICQQDVVGPCSLPSGSFAGYGGTSVASPAFAGIMALVDQEMQLPQGNPNFVLYKLASQKPNAFHDVASGSTIAMPCFNGSLGCAVNSPTDAYGVLSGYGTGTGYDLATGLGSVDANNLVTNWSQVTFTATATNLTLNSGNPVNITHGQPVSVNIGVNPAAANGDASLLVSSGVGNVAGQAIDIFHLSGGSVSATTDLLPGGTNYKVFAHYSGDATHGGSYSNSVTLNVGKESSNVSVPGLLTSVGPSGSPVYSSSVVYGSPYALRVDVLNSAKTYCSPPPFGELACPSGNLALTDNGSPLDSGTYGLNSRGYAEDEVIQLAGGTHTLGAQYGGDGSFVASAGSTVVAVTPASTTSALQIPGSGDVGGPFSATAIVHTQSSGLAPGGTVTFSANGSPIAGAISYSGAVGSASAPASLTATFYSSTFPNAVGTYTITESYSGDQNYGASTSPGTSLAIKYPTPNLNLQPSSSSIASGSSLTLTALVVTSKHGPTPTGTVQFIGSSTGSISGNITLTPVVDNSGNSDLQATITFVPVGSDSFAAQFSGDSNYPAAQGVTGTVRIVGADFSLLWPQHNSATVTPGQGVQLSLGVIMQSSAAPVTFSSAPCSGLPAETTCSITSPVNSTSTVQLNIHTTAAHARLNHASNSRTTEWWATVGATVGIFLLRGSKRRHSNDLLSFVLFALVAALPACGGGSRGGGASDPGTPAGTSTVTVAATSGAVTHTTTFTLEVQ
jgi:hypothetical protein